MKLLLNLTILFFITITANAQKDVTTFLGIPVDGTKESMTKQLEAKGFISTKAVINLWVLLLNVK